MLRVVLFLLVANLAPLGCATKFAPPSVEKGEPVMFSVEELDPSPWIEKTDPQKRDLWFKFSPDRKEWWIDWDAERLPFDLVVVHHSAGPADQPVEEIEADHLARLYGGRYKGTWDDPYVVGLEPHSGHVVNGKETFIGYHHLVYPDGRILNTLSPLINTNGVWYIDHVGWHAGNWKDGNCPGVAICLIGDYTDSVPPAKQLNAVKKLIGYYKQFNQNLTVEPHNHFNPRTACPGKKWKLWAPQIIQ